VALSMFGLTGVGAGEITSYSFWCVEKGYAAWTGVLGAAVLHPQGIAPSGNDVLTVISRIFVDTTGGWAGDVFLVFAALALFETFVANVPSLSRQTAASLAVFGAFRWRDRHARDRWMLALMVGLPIVWGLLGVVVSSPLALVILGGILNALYLLVVAVAVLYLSFRETDPRIKDGRVFTTYLLVSAAAVFAVGVFSLVSVP
jgi:hypothetical protein